MRQMAPILGLLFLVACASAGNPSSAGDTRDFLSGDQLRATGAPTVEEAVHELRPAWLMAGRKSVSVNRGARRIEVCSGTRLVYIDGERARQTLQQISVLRVAGVRFIRPGGMRPDRDRSCPSHVAINVTTAPVEVTTASTEAYDKYTEAWRLAVEDDDRRGSVARLREALALDPGFAMAWRLLAVNFNAQGRVGESRHALQQALEYSSHASATEQLHIAAVHAQYSDYNLQESIRLYGELLARSPNDSLAHYNRALALRWLGAYGDALLHLDRVRELSPQGMSRPAARVWFRTLVSLGRIEEAETFLPNLREVDRRVGASKATCNAPRMPRRNSTIDGPCVSSTLRASIRPLSFRTEATVVA
ncbi:MAG: hypothetical protein IIB35_01205 [Gemmatimonadetes bacterium]|nr:hypothetical protein [Gemmatimonadota bacterium]MCH8253850.1 hypothetical protein [Gemmatimonadota bacterium]